MKFLLLGAWRSNTGPSNVNRALISNSDSSMRYLKWKRLGRIERWIKCIISNPIVVSGGITSFELRLIKLFHKKIIHIVHGYLKVENEVNHLNLPAEFIKNEAESLRLSRIILPVSEKYSMWLKEQLPEYFHKISFLNNGISINRRKSVPKIPMSIAVSGGNRGVKNNKIVCEAVAKLISDGYNCTFHVFGRLYDRGEDLPDFPFIDIKGHLNHDEYYNQLDSISLLVVNSELESFGLVVADALNCNCSLLLSQNVGSTSIFQLQDCDIVYNNHDVIELSHKILHLLLHPNADRIFQSVDIDAVSEKRMFLNLKEIAHEV